MVDFLSDSEKIIVQPHNFPDPDAIASAFGLQYLLKKQGKQSTIVYEGFLQRDVIKVFTKELGIEIFHMNDCEMSENDQIIIVDGCKGNKNVRDLIGDEVAIIDHHLNNDQEDVEFCDIRSDYGACSTIIASYYEELGIKIPKEVATAFLIGIYIDTNNFLRHVSKYDLEAHRQCFEIADTRFVSRVVRNKITKNDLVFFEYLSKNIQYFGKMAFCFFEQGCDQNLLGILGDYALSMLEVEFVVLCARNKSTIIFSLRNESQQWNASNILQEVLEGIGFGGGHFDMAGGIIEDLKYFNKASIIKSFQKSLGL